MIGYGNITMKKMQKDINRKLKEQNERNFKKRMKIKEVYQVARYLRKNHGLEASLGYITAIRMNWSKI